MRLRPPKFVHKLADRFGWQRYQSWACRNDFHFLEPTSLSPFFRVEEAECRWCSYETDFDDDIGPSLLPR